MEGDNTAIKGALFVIGVVLLLIALVYALAKSAVREGVSEARQDPPPPPAPPVATLATAIDRPGRFRVSGVDRETKMDTSWTVAADSTENAKVKADLEGIIVTKVERVT